MNATLGLRGMDWTRKRKLLHSRPEFFIAARIARVPIWGAVAHPLKYNDEENYDHAGTHGIGSRAWGAYWSLFRHVN